MSGKPVQAVEQMGEGLEIPKLDYQRKVSAGGGEVGGDSREEVAQFQALKHCSPAVHVEAFSNVGV